jgi:ankyrin repeat protein
LCEQRCKLTRSRFLLARLHTDSLLDKRTAKDVKLTLAKLSKGADALDDAYSDALQRIQGQLDGDRKLAKNVLSWITFAKRPLTTAEICCALAVEPDETEVDPENRPDVDDLVSVCAGLVVVDQDSAVIRLVHYTTQEYFERIRSAWNPDGERHMAKICLTYLSLSVFKSGSCPTDKEFEERLSQNEFLEYAAKHYGEHARSFQAEVASLACSFLLQSGLLSCLAQVLFVPNYKFRGYSKFYPAITSLHWTARFGLCDVAKEFLRTIKEDGTSAVNARDSWSQTPLIYAAEHGHFEIGKMLLEKGADVNAEGGRNYSNALYAASYGGHELVVKLLLDTGANVNAQGGHYGNALQAASAGGHELVVKLLLDAGADINAQGGCYGNAPHAAAYRGHTKVLELLFLKDTVLQLQDCYGRSLLWWAAAGGNTATIEALISQYHFDPRTTDKFGRTPLWIATRKGHEAVSKLLSDKCGETDTERTLSSESNGDQQRMECDVCTSSIKITAFHYHCRLCADGDWDVCEDCKTRGASCAEATHTLVKRTMTDGYWVEIVN